MPERTAADIRAPADVRWIVRTLEGAGFETWAVGGGVRDSILGIPSEDWDLATRARPPQVRKLFRRTVPIGIEHGTVGVLSRDGTLYEVTTFRRDVETTGRHAVVEFADTVEEDLARRDFTVNAVAWHPIREVLRDPFHGLGDLEVGLLRTVGDPLERFQEDYLRVLRALRFAGAYGLRVDPRTWKAVVRGTSHLGHLAPERIREELLKILEGVGRPSRALGLYAAAGALQGPFPELAALVGEERRDGGADDLWAHALRTADLLPSTRPELRVMALLSGVGWPDGPEAKGPGSKGESGSQWDVGRRGVLRAAALLERLRFSNRQIREWAATVEWLPRPPSVTADDAELRSWLAGATPPRLPVLFRIWLAEARANVLRGGGGRGPDEVLALRNRARRLLALDPPLSLDDLALDGRELIRMGFRPGPHFGVVLDELLQRVIEAPEENEPDLLARRARERLREMSAQEGDLEERK